MLNRTILAGRLAADPQVRYTKNEKAVCYFKLIINPSAGQKKNKDYITCVAWDGLAKICGQYLKKGRLVAVEGRLSFCKLEDKHGKDITRNEIIVENMQMLDSKFYNDAKKVGE